MLLKPEAIAAFRSFEILITESKRGGRRLSARASVCVSVYSSNTDVIAGSSPISLEGNSVIIPTPGHNGLLKQQWTE